MFDIGWSEMAVIALVTLVVFGPKELPAALRTGAKLMRQGRKLAREFQGSVDQLIKEAELEEVKNLATAAKRGRLDRELEKVIDPTGELKQAVDANAVKRELNADGASLPAPAPTAPAQTAPMPPPAVAGPASPPPASSAGGEVAAPKAEAEPEPATPTAPAN
jgi:sec-independent protein translocase protein TatB